MIDEAFSIFDPNGNGLIELEELQEFWGIVKNTLSGGGTLQALFTSKVPDPRGVATNVAWGSTAFDANRSPWVEMR
jgi:hypothetical protein